MNLLLNSIEHLDYRNVYVIKKIANTLLFEFQDAIKNGDKNKANTIRDLTKMVHSKILTNLFWAERVDKILTSMARKLHK